MPAIYQADTWCDSCAAEIRQKITNDGQAPSDHNNETTYDSDEFPKHMEADEEADTPQHCASGESCLEAEEIPGGKIGKLLSRELTDAGVQYVREYIMEGLSRIGGASNSRQRGTTSIYLKVSSKFFLTTTDS